MYKIEKVAHYDNVRERFFMKKYIIIGLISILFFQTFSTKSTNLLIPEEAIRLRVLANSNSTEDQYIKMKVSEAVQKDLYTLLKDTKGIESARTKIGQNLPNLRTKGADT